MRGAGRQDLYLADVDAQLVGCDLRERGADALPQIDLAGRNGHRAIALEMHALRQAPRIRE